MSWRARSRRPVHILSLEVGGGSVKGGEVRTGTAASVDAALELTSRCILVLDLVVKVQTALRFSLVHLVRQDLPLKLQQADPVTLEVDHLTYRPVDVLESQRRAHAALD